MVVTEAVEGVSFREWGVNVVQRQVRCHGRSEGATRVMGASWE